uniref:DC-UbP/UBTD2 N-terminal domain-containing protein n=1 Tax=Gadus morhua TaxID=8049 RepID=A0A8C5FPX5_GADMO
MMYLLPLPQTTDCGWSRSGVEGNHCLSRDGSHDLLDLSDPLPSGRNEPLRREGPPWKSEVPMTEGQLRGKRDEFWDTAPAFDGRKEIWDALRAAALAVEVNDLGLAQAIVDGACITLPHGSLTESYDELGNRYQLPAYTLALPVNLLTETTCSKDLPPASETPAPPPPPKQEFQLRVRLSSGRKRPRYLSGPGAPLINTIRRSHWAQENALGSGEHTGLRRTHWAQENTLGSGEHTGLRRTHWAQENTLSRTHWAQENTLGSGEHTGLRRTHWAQENTLGSGEHTGLSRTHWAQ